jgi:hypothetical protein
MRFLTVPAPAAGPQLCHFIDVKNNFCLLGKLECKIGTVTYIHKCYRISIGVRKQFILKWTHQRVRTE